MSNQKPPEIVRPQRAMPISEKAMKEPDLFPSMLEREPSDQDIALIALEHRILRRNNSNSVCAPLMELNYTKDIEPSQDTIVHGVFLHHEGKLTFAPTKEGHYKKTVVCSNLLPGVEPLTEYFELHDLLVVLRGRISGRIFFVSEIHSGGIVRESGSSFSGPSDTAIQAICNRIRYDSKQLCDDATHRKGYILTQEAEIRLLYSVVKAKLSAPQCDWIEHNFARMSAPNLNRDEKGHIIRAVSYVLNVNWKPRQLKLLPYDAIKAHLDKRFFGIENVKTRILEVIAQIRRCGTLPQWGILLNGPAGVGKTSIASEIAKALNMQLLTIDMSTTNDPESLVGSSRIYSNAKPGLIAEKILANRDSNCVMLLNELDKASAGKDRGNPADTLLTLVDKLGFIDNFLETSIDTTNIFFIATCNDLSKISKPLQDRFLRIDIDGYSAHEKKTIFTNYVLPKTLELSHVCEDEVQVTEDFTEHLCKYYATDPGVRDLEQYAERLIGDFLLRHERDGIEARTYGENDIVSLFGRRAARSRTLASAPGQAKTIVCYEQKSYHALIQATCVKGTGEFNIYGASNNYHKDCCKVAYECAKTLSDADFSHSDIALFITSNVPATTQNFLGCATFMAVMSAITKRELPTDVAYLGGCDLLGNLFWDESDLTHVINCAESAGDTVLYGPIGLAELTRESSNVRIIESYNAALLFEVSAK